MLPISSSSECLSGAVHLAHVHPEKSDEVSLRISLCTALVPALVPVAPDCRHTPGRLECQSSGREKMHSHAKVSQFNLRT